MNLIVPIDFSDQSKSAAEFAASLIKVQGGTLHLVHVLVPMDNEPDYLPVKAMASKLNTVFEMYILQEKLRHTYGVRSSCDLMPGDITEQIIAAARRKKSELIIMGNQGNSGLRKHLYGSHTASVMEASPIPVLTLPEGFALKELRRVVYATDYSESNLSDIQHIADFARIFDAGISLFHVNEENVPGHFDQSINDFQEMIREKVDYPHIRFEECTNTDTAEGLRNLLQTQYADMLVIPNNRKTLVEKITRNSDDFIFDLDIPVLVY